MRSSRRFVAAALCSVAVAPCAWAEPVTIDRAVVRFYAPETGGVERPRFIYERRLAFEWFTGRNDLGIPVCDPSTGACCDGLHADRVNQNQGAESTLAYLLALAEMQLLESS